MIYDSIGRKNEMKRLIDIEFANNPAFFRKVIAIFTPTVFSTASEQPLKGIFSAENYLFLSQFVDTNMLYDKVIKAVGKLTTGAVRNFSLGDALSENDLLYLFQLLYEVSQKDNESTGVTSISPKLN
jgi:hypothetical protein